MKYIMRYITAITLIVACTSIAEAQFLKKLKKKAQNALEQKADQKIDEEMQKAADRMVESSWTTVFGTEGENGQPGGSLPFKFNSNVKTEALYQFDTISTMKIESERSDGKSDPPLYMDMHFREGSQYTGTKFRGGEMDKAEGNLFIIYDFKNSAMVMLMESDDGKFSFAYDWQQSMQIPEEPGTQSQSSETEELEESEEWNGYTRIGSKEIAGYNCDGYRSENDHQVVELWVTRDANYGMQNMFKANTNAKQLKGKMPAEYPYGMLMEMTSNDLQSGDKVSMKIIDVRSGSDISYAMADYPSMSLTKQ